MEHDKGIQFTPKTRGNITYACAEGLWVAAPFRLPVAHNGQATGATEPARADETPSSDTALIAQGRHPPRALVLEGGTRAFVELIKGTVGAHDFSIDVRLRRAAKAVEAAESIFQAAIADDGPPQTTCPLLVGAIQEAPTLFGLCSTLVDATLSGGDVAATRCLDVALRIEALGRSYARLAKDVRAREAMRPIRDYLFGTADIRMRVTDSVVDMADSDAWMPVLDIARAAGQTCSPMLLQRAHAEARRRAQESTRIITGTGRTKMCSAYRPLHGYAAATMLALKAFAKGMCDSRTTCSGDGWMDLCRGPARLVVRTLRRAIETARVSVCPMPALGPILKARTALTLAIDMTAGNRRHALVYTLGLLTTIVAAHEGGGDIEDDPALQKLCLELQDPTRPSHAIALEGLEITSIDGGGAKDGADSGADVGASEVAPYLQQDDLLTRAWDHHPDLFTAIIARVGPWDIGSVALASRTHYARIVKVLRDEDGDVGPESGLIGTTLAGTVWLQRALDSRAYDPVARRIEPPPGQGTLPDLRLLLFLCRFMPCLGRAEHASRIGLVVACNLECGGAVVRCINRLGFGEVDLMARRDREICLELTAREAGFRASPLALEVVIAESCRAATWNERCPEGSMPASSTAHALEIVSDTVTGIMRGLASARTSAEPLRTIAFSALADVLCAFLKRMRGGTPHGGVDAGWGDHVARIFRRKAMSLLAPGIALPAPLLRTRLALALVEASMPT
ncbi:hypothetical protein pqer_cds_628 [Pandoravirus quercus]|uniref:DUF5867 domain-containing protein n=1 Tax=Pandoravirus quercus TaxID=2107709 RepID=A0A2U7U9J6_9VIRU|nr:hypothetical protein pqer_cds_628 [Pandoravirus quercus]AVK75050.1 hypothetical protein pqer_cds_628 [Pandoravirus quercus]